MRIDWLILKAPTITIIRIARPWVQTHIREDILNKRWPPILNTSPTVAQPHPLTLHLPDSLGHTNLLSPSMLLPGPRMSFLWPLPANSYLSFPLPCPSTSRLFEFWQIHLYGTLLSRFLNCCQVLVSRCTPAETLVETQNDNVKQAPRKRPLCHRVINAPPLAPKPF